MNIKYLSVLFNYTYKIHLVLSPVVETIWKMQIAAFQDLFAKYQDTETSPATEPLEKVIIRLSQPYTVSIR